MARELIVLEHSDTVISKYLLFFSKRPLSLKGRETAQRREGKKPCFTSFPLRLPYTQLDWASRSEKIGFPRMRE